MYNYYAYGLRIKSELEIPNFVPSDFKTSDVKIKLDHLDIPSKDIVLEGKHYKVTPKGTYFFRDDMGVTKVQNGNEIIVDPSNDINFLRFLIMGAVFAVLLHQRGFLVLHGSAVRLNKKAIIFLGESGVGKSSIAFGLNNQGFPLVSDDILPISFKEDMPVVSPGYPHLKISEDILKASMHEPAELPKIHVRSSKRSKPATKNFSTDTLKIKTIYILSDGNKTIIKNLSPHDSFTNLISNSYNLHRFLEEDRIKNLKQCAEVVKKVPIKLLKIQRSLNGLPDLVKLVEYDLYG